MSSPASDNTRQPPVRLYDAAGRPATDFNRKILGWLEGTIRVREHQPPKVFQELRTKYAEGVDAALRAARDRAPTRWHAHEFMLSRVTDLMFGIDLGALVAGRMSAESINKGGFRSKHSQSVAKNSGENFINLLVWALADVLSVQDEILVDKGLPPPIRDALTLVRPFRSKSGAVRELEVPIETDFCIFSRTDPHNAIIGSAKTRLKEVFHIGTMWKILFDCIDDDYCLKKWGMRRRVVGASKKLSRMQYIFATADMIAKGAQDSQGGDVERKEIRNLIAVDASFFDYVFVSKHGIPHVSSCMEVGGGREALFHELGCILHLIEQKYGLKRE